MAKDMKDSSKQNLSGCENMAEDFEFVMGLVLKSG